MSNPTIKFFRSQSAPTNPIEGYVWFKTDDRTINLYKNGVWEAYAGVLSASYIDNVLTITPAVGDTVTVDLSGMVTSSTIDTLSQNLSALQNEFNAEKGKISTLESNYTTLNNNINTEKGRIDALLASDSGSIRDIAIEVLTDTLVADNASESLDTLQEVSEWIKNHPNEAAAFNSDIASLKTKVSALEAIDHDAYVSYTNELLSWGEY